MKPGRTGFARIIAATGYSLSGLRAAWQHEAAFRQELVGGGLLIILALFIARSPGQWLLLSGPIILLWIIELINSAIEATVDRIGPERHELAGRAKDMGSATVMLTIGLGLLCWAVVLWENYFR